MLFFALLIECVNDIQNGRQFASQNRGAKAQYKIPPHQMALEVMIILTTVKFQPLFRVNLFIIAVLAVAKYN